MERLFTFFFFSSLDLISLCGEYVYLRRNENHTKLYVEKADGFYRITSVRIKVLAQPGKGKRERSGRWQAGLRVAAAEFEACSRRATAAGVGL